LAVGTIKNKKYPLDKVTELIEAMNTLVKMCGFAIALNKSLIDETHLKFQAMVQDFYLQLRDKVNAMTDAMRKEMQETTTK